MLQAGASPQQVESLAAIARLGHTILAVENHYGYNELIYFV